MMSVYGYLHSRDETDKDNEKAMLLSAGVLEPNIMTGNLDSALVDLKEGDHLVVRSLTTLGTSLNAVYKRWLYLTNEKKVKVVCLDMPFMNTLDDKGPVDALIYEIASDIFLYLIESDRKIRHRRQRDGIDEAMRNGVKFGHKPIEIPENFVQVRKHWELKEISAASAAKFLGVSTNTFLKWTRQNNAETELSGP